MHTWNHEPKGNLASKLFGTAGLKNSWSRVDAMLDPQSKTPYRIPMEKEAWQEAVMKGITGWWYTYHYLPLWKMMEFVTWGHDIPFPRYGKSFKNPMVPVTTNQKFAFENRCPWNLLKCHPKGYQAAHHQCDIFHVQTPGGHICGHQCLAGALGEILVRWSCGRGHSKNLLCSRKNGNFYMILSKHVKNTNGISVPKLKLGHLMVN